MEYLAFVFKICKEVRLKLNPNKCHFLVLEGTLLGHIVSSKDLAPNLDKVIAILKLLPLVNACSQP